MSLPELIQKYDKSPHSLYPQDLFPLVEFLIAQTVSIPAKHHAAIRKTGEAEMPETVSGVFVLHSKAGTTETGTTDVAAMITIGIHGNEIWAGALCVLEALSQHSKGNLKGTVIIQVGNIKAIQGYIRAYDPKTYFLDRNGWRETNGIEREVSAVYCDDGTRVDVLSDFNRIPREVMTLPRGQNENVNRAQDLLWLYRAFLRGFKIDESATLYRADNETPYKIAFAMHPHTSRMVGGIRNISLAPMTTQKFFDGHFDDLLRGLPEDLTTMLEWVKGGLGGPENLIFDEHIEIQYMAEKEHVELTPLIITFELGHHEDFCPKNMSCMADLCGPATRVLLENTNCIEAVASDKAPAKIKTLYTAPYRLDLSYYDGFRALEEGDMIYLAIEQEAVNASAQYIAGHFSKTIIVSDDGTCKIIETKAITGDTSGRIFYCMPPFELSYLKTGQPLMIAFGLDKKAKFLSAPHDMYAVFTGDCRLEFPIVHWRPEIGKQKTFFRGLTQDIRSI